MNKILNKKGHITSFIKTRWNNFLFQDKQRNETDYFIYYDLDFFLILLLIEFAKKWKTSVTLWEFIGYWLQNISNKSPYTLNYDTYIDYILKLLDNNFMYGDRFKFFQHEGITINSRYIYGSMMDNVAKIINEDIEPYEKVSDLDSVVGLTHNMNKYAWHYWNIIQEYNDLEKKYKKWAHENKYNFSIWKDNYELGHIFELAPKNIYLNFSFNKDQIKNIEDNILSYLVEWNFWWDYPVSEQECILCFSKYKMKNDIIQVPFSILWNQDFDVMKTLKYMEYKWYIQFIDFLNIDDWYWEVKILNENILTYIWEEQEGDKSISFNWNKLSFWDKEELITQNRLLAFFEVSFKNGKLRKKILKTDLIERIYGKNDVYSMGWFNSTVKKITEIFNLIEYDKYYSYADPTYLTLKEKKLKPKKTSKKPL